jgi:signal recognition particle receptor subunit beta
MFVVDATSNNEQLEESRDALHDIMAHEDLTSVVLMVWASKCDRRDAMTVTQLSRALNLDKIRQRHIIKPSSAVTGAGVVEGLYALDQLVIAKN